MQKEEKIYFRILHIEEEEDIRFAISKALSGFCTKLHSAESARQGIELYRRYKPEIVIFDITAKDMAQTAIYKTIKETDPEAQIILTMTHQDQHLLMKCIDLGICHYLLKPVNNDKLYNAIASCAKTLLLEERVCKLQNQLNQITLYSESTSLLWPGSEVSSSLKDISFISEQLLKSGLDSWQSEQVQKILHANHRIRQNLSCCGRESGSESVPQSPPLLKAFVLVVEDKESNQKVLEIMLKNMGCRLDIAPNGKRALDMFSQKEYDIILMDIQMPVMDGLTATRELRKKYSKLPPIIGVSANALAKDAQYYISQGLDDYVSKPVKPQLLYDKIQSWLKKPANAPLSQAFSKTSDATHGFSSDTYDLDKLEDLDEAMIESLISQTHSDMQIITDLFQTYLKEAQLMSRRIEDGFKKKDYTLVMEGTHSLKGLSATVGAQKVYRITDHMNMLHKRNDYMQSQKHLSLLQINMDVVKEIIQSRFPASNQSHE